MGLLKDSLSAYSDKLWSMSSHVRTNYRSWRVFAGHYSRDQLLATSFVSCLSAGGTSHVLSGLRSQHGLESDHELYFLFGSEKWLNNKNQAIF